MITTKQVAKARRDTILLEGSLAVRDGEECASSKLGGVVYDRNSANVDPMQQWEKPVTGDVPGAFRFPTLPYTKTRRWEH